ncbi:Uu.00g055170.m01.CDS01 [Anthostomella pinea]|uniref:Uu.00g055170.m01.CDS01 n=1 Tax=Anthostomella pinea TaxID=933095 RepID=A0AAI8VWQ7_9PEZI|nr:Uu.00g055170.m01.CDS01 [Anthostomella pinea]
MKNRPSRRLASSAELGDFSDPVLRPACLNHQTDASQDGLPFIHERKKHVRGNKEVTSSRTMSERPKTKTDRRRRRPALACVSCRRSKIRCDLRQPCGACVRSRHKTCTFESLDPSDPSDPSAVQSSEIGSAQVGQPKAAGASAGPDEAQLSPAASPSATHHEDTVDDEPTLASLGGTTSVGSITTVPDVNSLLQRIWELERRLDETTAHQSPAKPARPSATNPSEPILSYLAPDFHSMSKSVMSKTRYFGQSHWMNGVMHFKPVLELFERQSRDTKSETRGILAKCKALARTVKAQRVPELISKVGTNMPTREVADKLVDGYLRTTETVFRILHVPAFRRDYDLFWASPTSADPAFVLQLQLVMAIGSTIYDEHFSMRKSAVQWIHEAQYWFLGPVPKSRLTIAALQIMLLLCLAREAASVGSDLVWISIGSVMRSAIYMGLHRDPSRLPGMTRTHSELRRRLWNTILELELQSSLDSGGPPMISLENSDTNAPANLDDADLANDGDVQAILKTSDKFTDMTVALALRKSFRERLAIAQLLNDIVSKGTYEDTIRLHRQLSTSYKSLAQTFRGFVATGRQPTSFQCRFVDYIVRRYFMALHIPFCNPSVREPAFAFSRKEVVDSAVKLYCTVFPTGALGSGPLTPTAAETEVICTEGDDLASFAVCGSGFFRCILTQASFLVALEIQTQLQEDSGLGPPTTRPDLLNILRHTVSFSLARIKAGETNVKGYLFNVAIATHVDALLDGRKGQAVVEPILAAAIKTQRQCFEILGEQAGLNQTEDVDGGGQFDWDGMMATDEAWSDDMSMTNPFFDLTSIDAMLGTDIGANFMTASDPSHW